MRLSYFVQRVRAGYMNLVLHINWEKEKYCRSLQITYLCVKTVQPRVWKVFAKTKPVSVTNELTKLGSDTH